MADGLRGSSQEQSTIINHKSNEAWQLARELARKVYGLTMKARFARDFGLKGQIQDAAD